MNNGRIARVFNGTYSIENRSTGEHRTFRIHTQPNSAKFAPRSRIVSLLCGPNNTTDYRGFAFINDQGIHVWQKKTGFVRNGDEARTGQHTDWDWYAEMLWSLATDPNSEWMRAGYGLQMSGACVRCNRKLTTPQSIRSGIGPICAKRSR